MAIFKQLIKPNLDDDPKHPLYVYVYDEKKKKTVLCTNWVSWCLAVAKAAFGATKSMHSALNAWNNNTTKHANYDLPEGVYCLIWWNGYWYNGEELGHVAIAKRTGDRVKIWSSPYKKSYTFAIFEGPIKSTIDSLIKTYKLNKYLGWTETICEKRVIEQVKENKKSNEEICKEVWEGKWGNGKDREKRLTEAGYDYATIQKMVKDGVGKPEPAKVIKEEKKSEPQEAQKEDKPMTEPTTITEPTQNGSSEATEPITTNSPVPNESDNLPISGDSLLAPDSEIKNDETADGDKGEFVPATAQDGKYIDSIIEQASADFNPPKTVKLIAYLVGDAFLVGSLLLPDIVNTIQAPTPNVWAEYLSKVLLEAGIAILVVFKLFKRKK